MIFDVKEEEGKIVVFVEIPHSKNFGRKTIPRQEMTTESVILELTKRGIDVDRPTQRDHVKNWREHTRRGTWIFEKKIEKVLDKPAENVILSKEKKPAPKKRKSRAKKKTSK